MNPMRGGRCSPAVCNSSGPAKNIHLEFCPDELHPPPMEFHQAIATLAASPKQAAFHLCGWFVAKNLRSF